MSSTNRIPFLWVLDGVKFTLYLHMGGTDIIIIIYSYCDNPGDHKVNFSIMDELMSVGIRLNLIYSTWSQFSQ